METARLSLLMDLMSIETHALRLSRQLPGQRDLREILPLAREALDREKGRRTIAPVINRSRQTRSQVSPHHEGNARMSSSLL
jgi:hypothetical protein